jgi:zinc protease
MITFDRSKPPAPGKPRPFTFPDYIKTKVCGEIPLYIIQNNFVPLASVQLVFRSGSNCEGDKAGLANFTSELLLSGTKNRDTVQLAEEIDYLGSRLESYCGRDEITISLGILSKFLEKGIELMSDIAINPIFPIEEIDRERKHAISAIVQNQADASYLSAIQFKKEIFGATPYGREITGTKDSLNNLTIDDCINFHKNNFTSDNAFFIAAGDITEDSIKSLLEKYFSNWVSKKVEVVKNFDFPIKHESNKVTLIHRPKSVQSSLRIGKRSIERNNPDYLPLTILNTLFGGYFNSRLNINLREKNGYTYGVRSSLESNNSIGSFYIGSQVRLDITSNAIQECFNELNLINEVLIPSEELNIVKNYLIGSQALQLETSEQVASFVRAISIYNLDDDYYKNLASLIRQISSEQLKELSNKYLFNSGYDIIVCGDATKIKDSLFQFGELKIINQKGESIEI